MPPPSSTPCISASVPRMSATEVSERRLPPDRRRVLWLPELSVVAILVGMSSICAYALMEVSAPVLLGYVVFGLCGLAVVARLGTAPIQLYLAVYGLAGAAAVTLSLIFTSAYGVPYCGGGSDELEYEDGGISFAAEYGVLDYMAIRGNVVKESHNSVGYIYIVGLLAKLSQSCGDFHTMVPRLLNGVCLALISVLVFQIGCRVDLKRRTAAGAALFAGCLPLMMWTAVQTLRDTIQTLLLLWIVFVLVPDRKGRWPYPCAISLIFCALVLPAIWELRSAQALVAVLVIGVGIVCYRRALTPLRMLLLTLPACVAALVVGSIFIGPMREQIEVFTGGIESYAQYRTSEGIGGGLSRIVFETALFPVGWIYRTLYALVSPLPVQYRVLDQAWLSLGTICHFLFLPFLVMGLVRAARSWQWPAIVAAFVLLFAGMAMFTFSVRHMVQFMPYAVLLSALGYERFQGRRWAVFLSTGTLGALLGVTYMVTKGL